MKTTKFSKSITTLLIVSALSIPIFANATSSVGNPAAANSEQDVSVEQLYGEGGAFTGGGTDKGDGGSPGSGKGGAQTEGEGGA